ncbi:ATP-binding response regulator [Pelagibaculum spongiae]|nr:hybrid sensor histidine kinase/response regulator [Pelagibaculum spongiae]
MLWMHATAIYPNEYPYNAKKNSRSALQKQGELLLLATRVISFLEGEARMLARSIKLKITEELLIYITKQLMGALSFAVIISWLIWSTLSEQMINKTAWITYANSIFIGCLLFVLYTKHTNQWHSLSLKLQLNLHRIIALLSSSVWLMLILSLSNINTSSDIAATHLTTILVISLGLSAAAALANSAIPSAFYIFTTPINVALTIKLNQLTELFPFAIAFTYIIPFYLLSQFYYAWHMHTQLKREVTYRLENIQLAKLHALAKEKAEQSNLEKSRFLAAASHDLRQPLHALGLYSELLLNENEINKIKPLAQSIYKSCDGLRTMLDAILDLSRIQSQTIKPDLQAINTREVINSLKESFSAAAYKKGLGLKFYGSDLLCLTDTTLLRRILWNLVSNSIRYTYKGRIIVCFRKRQHKLLIQVWDSGIGIEPENVKNIFTEYFQVSNPERDQQRGLGLGLSIVDGLCHTLNTKIHCQSLHGKGSCFSFSQPVTQVDLKKTQTKEIPPKKNITPSILLIDDDSNIRNAVTQLLNSWQFTIKTAENTLQAEQYIKTGYQPQVIISDFRLRGEENGIDTLNRLNQQLPEPALSILLTGDTDPQRIKQTTMSGFTLLHKPIQPAKLRLVITRLLVKKLSENNSPIETPSRTCNS